MKINCRNINCDNSKKLLIRKVEDGKYERKNSATTAVPAQTSGKILCQFKVQSIQFCADGMSEHIQIHGHFHCVVTTLDNGINPLKRPVDDLNRTSGHKLRLTSIARVAESSSN